MAIGERFRSGGAHGIARFLAEHQRCNAGFDVRRDDQLGSGKLSITCEGCGGSVEYRAAEAGELAAGGPQTGPVPANGAPVAPVAAPPPPVESSAPAPPAPVAPVAPPAPVEPSAAPPSNWGAPPSQAPPTARPVGTPGLPAGRKPPQARPRSHRKGGVSGWASDALSRYRRGALPDWVPVALIAALILGGLTMIAIGLTKEDEQPPAAPPGGQAPAQGKPGSGQGQQPATGQNQQQTGAAAPQGAGAAALNRRTFADRFAIGVPARWDDGLEDGGVALTAPGATAGIVVFFQQGGAPEPQLARGARAFLAERHPGAQVGAAKPVRIGPEKGLRMVATYPGGEEVAVVISAGGFSHLILRRVDRGASPEIEQQADAALASFRAKA